MNRELDIEIAIKLKGWKWEKRYHRSLLIPPEDSEMRHWTAMWNTEGIPHFLPEYSKQISQEELNKLI